MGTQNPRRSVILPRGSPLTRWGATPPWWSLVVLMTSWSWERRQRIVQPRNASETIRIFNMKNYFEICYKSLSTGNISEWKCFDLSVKEKCRQVTRVWKANASLPVTPTLQILPFRSKGSKDIRRASNVWAKCILRHSCWYDTMRNFENRYLFDTYLNHQLI